MKLHINLVRKNLNRDKKKNLEPLTLRMTGHAYHITHNETRVLHMTNNQNSCREILSHIQQFLHTFF